MDLVDMKEKNKQSTILNLNFLSFLSFPFLSFPFLPYFNPLNQSINPLSIRNPHESNPQK